MKTLKQLLEMWEHPFSGSDLRGNDDTYSSADIKWGDPLPENVVQARENVKNHHDFLINHYGHYKQKPIDSAKSLYKYETNSHPLNSWLLHKAGVKDFPDEYKDHYKESDLDDWHTKLKEILGKHETPHDMHVYSGLSWSPARYNHKLDSGVIKMHLPAFTSTTISPGVTQIFSWKDHNLDDNHPYREHHNIMKIHVPKGSHSFYIGTSEHEMLLPSDSHVHIHPEPHLHTYDYKDRQEHVAVWHAKLVHDGLKPTRHMTE